MKKNNTKLFGAGFLSLLFCCSVLVCNCAFASSASEMLRTKGVLLLLDGDHNQALRKFNLALRLDGKDALALYYRGVTHSRLGDFKQAVNDMQQAAESGIYFGQLDFELGYAYLFDGRLDAALDTLYEAQSRSPNHAPAKYYLGLVYYQKQEYTKAIQLLLWARDLDADFGASVAYLVADAHYKNADTEKARSVLLAGLKDYPESVYRKPMEDLLRKITSASDAGKGYELAVVLGAALDSNVGLLPDEDLLANAELSDTRVHLDVDASTNVYAAYGMALRAGLRLFQNTHSELSEYDFQKTAVYVDLQDNRQGWAWGGHMAFGQAKLASSKLYDSVVLMPYMFLHHNPVSYSLLSFQLRDVDYVLAGEEGRSSYYYEGLYRYYWLPNVNAGTRFSIQGQVYLDDTADTELKYNGLGIGFALEYGIDELSSLNAVLGVKNREYPDSVISRTVDRLELNAQYEYGLMDNLFLQVFFGYTDSSSNNLLYDYERWVLGSQIRWEM